MIVGMVIVFSFLIMLVFALKAQSWIINRYFPEIIKTSQPIQNIKNQKDDKIVAVIMAAIVAYKKTRQ